MSSSSSCSIDLHLYLYRVVAVAVFTSLYLHLIVVVVVVFIYICYITRRRKNIYTYLPKDEGYIITITIFLVGLIKRNIILQL